MGRLEFSVISIGASLMEAQQKSLGPSPPKNEEGCHQAGSCDTIIPAQSQPRRRSPKFAEHLGDERLSRQGVGGRLRDEDEQTVCHRSECSIGSTVRGGIPVVRQRFVNAAMRGCRKARKNTSFR